VRIGDISNHTRTRKPLIYSRNDNKYGFQRFIFIWKVENIFNKRIDSAVKLIPTSTDIIELNVDRRFNIVLIPNNPLVICFHRMLD